MFRFGRKKTTTAHMIAAGISVVAVSFIPHGTNNTGKKAQLSLILIRSQVNEYWIFIRYITVKSAMVICFCGLGGVQRLMAFFISLIFLTSKNVVLI